MLQGGPGWGATGPFGRRGVAATPLRHIRNCGKSRDGGVATPWSATGEGVASAPLSRNLFSFSKPLQSKDAFLEANAFSPVLSCSILKVSCAVFRHPAYLIISHHFPSSVATTIPEFPCPSRILPYPFKTGQAPSLGTDGQGNLTP